MSAISKSLQEQIFGPGLRADSAATAIQILEAADQLLSVNPYATLEEIGAAAQVSRTTIYRRFPTRRELSIALSRWAVGRIVEALQKAQIGLVPAFVGLYQATRNVIEVKGSLEFTRNLALPDDAVVAGYQDQMKRITTELLSQCQQEGLLRAEVDIEWARLMFYALIHEASRFHVEDSPDHSIEGLTRLVVDSLLQGLGTAKAS